MSRTWWSLLLLVTVVFGAGQVSAGQGGGMRQVPWPVEQIKERLGTENALTDEQAKKVEAVNTEFAKKMDEAKKKDGVAAAQAEVDKAREARDRDAMQAAFKKLSDAMGFNPRDEYKKALTPALNEAQINKLFTFGARKKAE